MDAKSTVGHQAVRPCPPAGYGKTTLLSQWVARGDVRPAWISLEGGVHRDLPAIILPPS